MLINNVLDYAMRHPNANVQEEVSRLLAPTSRETIYQERHLLLERICGKTSLDPIRDTEEVYVQLYKLRCAIMRGVPLSAYSVNDHATAIVKAQGF